MSDNLNNTATTVNLTVTTGFTVQSDVTLARVLGTIYQNLTGRPMFVSVYITVVGAGLLAMTSDSNANPSTIIDFKGSVSTSDTVHGMIPAGNYYKVNAVAGATITGWLETS